MKKLWSGINNNRLHTISQIVHNGQVINKLTEIANVFNHYFVNIASKIDDGISQTRKSPLDYLGRKSELSSFFLSPTDTAEVECITAEFKNCKALGPYSIPCNLLKLLSPYIFSVLVILINESFTTGIFPDKLKMAEVIALHKKGASDNLSNYRPISLLSIFGKIFEKIMYKRLYKFLEINEILHLYSLVFVRITQYLIL